ncbi:MAG: peptidoglycan editing factor PgeF [Alphaproteobacteria bacterium]|nr:peptidoglycan editing factor PgeF [Alphaproteobacteria bacterium]
MSDHTICPTFKNPHTFFSRAGGVSIGLYEGLNCGPGSDDDPANVEENRRIAAGMLAARRSTPVLSCYQVHGRDVAVATADWGTDRPKADAMVTNIPGMILGILTADCTPVLFEDASAGVVGAAHAGWKGALAGVTDATVEAMEKLGAKRSSIKAAVGPTIHQASYEVDLDFRDRFTSEQPDFDRFFLPGKDPWHVQFDLPGFVKYRLEADDIESVWMSGVDTYTSEDHFSFRRTTHRKEADYGRQMSAIMLKP